MKQVLAPVLFLFYINEFAKLHPTYFFPVMFADDVSFLASAKTTQQAEASVQDVDIVVKWSRKWKLLLNCSKSETSCFAFFAKDWCPTIHIIINYRVVRYEPYAKLLGVTLTFGKHDSQSSIDKYYVILRKIIKIVFEI